MINFEKHTLSNGLKLIIHQNNTTELTTLNILYNIGAKHESPNKTGFAHLFEHLMFGGSQHIAHYDTVAQQIGAENNAFTSNDITDYYLTFPTNNLETALWLEADRMQQLDFSEKSLTTQKNVVIEEFKQRYLNQPYGDMWLKMRPMAYKKHPYQWATIGKNIEHIEQATLADVKDFFYLHYRPNNAIMVIAGNIDPNEALTLTKKWFETIEQSTTTKPQLPKEPTQTQAQHLDIHADVPLNALYKAYHMPSRISPDFYAADLLSDVMGRGKSSLLVDELVKKQTLFSNISAYISGETDESLLMISGNLSEGTTFDEAEKALQTQLDSLKNQLIDPDELQKVKNQAEASFVFGESNTQNVAMQLAFFELLGDAELINTDYKKYLDVSATQIQNAAQKILDPNNCSTIHYHKTIK